MEGKLIGNLDKAREVLKEKLRSLKSDIAQSQRKIDIHYAPIMEPLREISQKLDREGPATDWGKSVKRETADDLSMSDFIPDEYSGAIPGTSIIKRSTTPARSRKHVSWFSPGVFSSPTKAKIRPPKALSTTIAQPSFIDDEYIGEVLPETKKLRNP